MAFLSNKWRSFTDWLVLRVVDTNIHFEDKQKTWELET